MIAVDFSEFFSYNKGVFIEILSFKGGYL